ncbi:MAG: zinc-ribbon domain-containing protein [Cellulophaga sp.]|uniref:zinc-ribbon domain-containing protein n=1 Tax=unclassified Cellulophaga TaxID=2634405 RepID=UPI000C2CA096|nr:MULTISPECIES: zinc-ribbon domain-containing protein [unclassified Cellulophaga]MDO6491622.1 zinc-ribbon domain-containing protein [Cellulophaga sp. 2_MG-2023]MDO6493499.1 zinc-ribbon domain-containing protein [Cellulophaga sp. 3_MG-2023]PKB44511.1 zinc ribbon family protein [Cellulophaga sp. RHA19]
MIFYGSNSSHLKSQLTRQIPCSNCKESAKFSVEVYGKYAHLYWIPIFPIGKTGAAVCTNCNSVFEPRQMDHNLKLEYKNVKGETKTPIKHFSALFIIGILIAGLSFSSFLDGKNTEDYINQPQVNDVYRFKTEASYFSTMKIAAISDSIYFKVNEYETNKQSGINEIDIAKNYSKEQYGYTVEELKGLYKDKIIYEVDRD